jgi:nitrite reductase/ring-hydroxylating ferredoxin subunit
MAGYQKAANVQDLAPGTAMSVEVGGHQIALFNVGGQFYAIGGSCTHRGGPLGDGEVDGTTVTCPWHGATFDVCTGKNLTPPAAQAVPCYRVRVEGQDIQVELP